MMERLVAKIEQDDSVTELSKEINVLDAVHWIKEIVERNTHRDSIKMF